MHPLAYGIFKYLAYALGTGAYLTSLRRTSVGDFQVDDAWKLEDLVALLET